MGDLFVTEHSGPVGAQRVVLVHGSLDRSSAFARTARLLADLEVVRYDRRGYGRSLGVGPGRTLQDHVTDLAAVVGSRSSVIVGHSMGGVVALALAGQRPELVSAVVAYEAPMPWEPWWPSATAGGAAMADDTQAEAGDAAERFMRRMVGDERWEALPARTRDQRRAEGPALLAELRAVRPPNPAPYVAEDLTVPVVAAHGSASSPHHQASARHLAERAPRGELAQIEGAAHGVHLSHPAELARVTRRAAAIALHGER